LNDPRDLSPDVRVIVGSGGQGRVVLDVWRAAAPTASFVFLDDAAAAQGTSHFGVSVVGTTELLASLLGNEVLFALGNNPVRVRLGEAHLARGGRLATVVHPSAVVSREAVLGVGTVVFPLACVHTAATVGRHVIVNTGALVEHDAVIGDGASLSPGVKTGGRVMVGAMAFLSTGVTLGARAHVGAGCIVGAGSVVVGELAANSVAYGVPARCVRNATPDDFKRVL
jgi:sugar O-acyltransferase (sialic acid O-acetyltransferase NeuD family)